MLTIRRRPLSPEAGSRFLKKWRVMQLPKDPHKLIFSIGFAVVLAVELYKFIVFIAQR